MWILQTRILGEEWREAWRNNVAGEAWNNTRGSAARPIGEIDHHMGCYASTHRPTCCPPRCRHPPWLPTPSREHRNHRTSPQIFLIAPCMAAASLRGSRGGHFGRSMPNPVVLPQLQKGL